MRLIDTHCHLNHGDFAADLTPAIERAVEAGVEAMLVIGYDMASSEQAVELADAHARLWAAVGVHPYEAEAVTPAVLGRLRQLAAHPRVAAIGEIGFDFYRDVAPVEAQERAFRAQNELALAAGLPVVVHTRASTTAALDMLLEYTARGLRGVLHCWSGTNAEARRAIAAGWYLGIGGVVTFKNAVELHRVAAAASVENLLLETDAPYLAPQPRRGKRNEPAYLPWIAERMAALRGCGVEEIAARTTENALAAFPRMRAE